MNMFQCNILVMELFFVGAFLYFWFLIREYLRDLLDFSWMLKANIKLHYLQKTV